MELIGSNLLVVLIFVSMAFAALLVARPSLTARRGGKIVAFLALFVMPSVALWAGLSVHMEGSKSTRFCLSCHVMEPYGESLLVDESFALPASHFQNRRIDREHACFTCHTTYTMFGDYEAKLKGLKHLYINYLGEIPDKIELYDPFQNRECLHCHAGARTYLEMHEDDLESLQTDEMSCLDCHDMTHAIEDIETAPRWGDSVEALLEATE
jgi:nitrate/TMAO reductase-like tetraheme cytochrome c subunit